MDQYSEKQTEWRNDQEMTPAAYIKDDSGETWWCNIHERVASHVMFRSGDEKPTHHCDPKLGGVMMPCVCVNLTGLVGLVTIDTQNERDPSC